MADSAPNTIPSIESATPSRRRFFSHAVALAAVVPLAGPALASSDDASLLDMLAEIIRLRDEADAIDEARVQPHEGEMIDIMHSKGSEAAWAFGRTYGRDEAVEEANGLLQRADNLFEEMLKTPAQTKTGRAAKVKALLYHVMPHVEGHPNWRGPSADLDYDIEMCRSLLADLAGMTEEEIANV
jgi:hypothetical protein